MYAAGAVSRRLGLIGAFRTLLMVRFAPTWLGSGDGGREKEEEGKEYGLGFEKKRRKIEEKEGLNRK